jgi:hypothetical protein
MSKKPWAVHPLLFAAYPALFVLAQNLERVPLTELLLPLGIILVVVAVSVLLLSWPLHSLHKAAVLASPAWLLFWYYTTVFEQLEGFKLWGVAVGRQRYLLAVIALALGGLLVAVWRSRRSLYNLTRIMNVVSACLIVTSLGQIAVYEVGHLGEGGRVAASADAAPQVKPSSRLPDVYYVILDGYGRSDILREVLNYDNSAFLQGLRDRGFYVADQAHANYCQTHPSLASSLNLDFVQNLGLKVNVQSDNRLPLTNYVKNNKVRKFLKAQGYTFVCFASGFAITEMRKADIYVSSSFSMSAYQTALMGQTPFALWQNGFVARRFQEHRNRVTRALAQLPDSSMHPKFVFAHVLSPHPPFVFGPQGEKVQPMDRYAIWDASHLLQRADWTMEHYIQGYTDQATYLNTLVLAAVDHILESSPTPPIIVIQADHGPGSHLDWNSLENTYLPERMSILNAYYFPDGDYSRLYPEITPVNSFRVVLSQFFGQDYPLVEDRSYFSLWDTPYQFIDVTDQVK